MSSKTKSDSDSSADSNGSNLIQKVSLQKLCDIYNLYPRMNDFIDRYETKELKDKLSTYKIVLGTDEKRDDDGNLILLLKLYKDMRRMDKERSRYMRRAQEYKQNNILYNGDNELANNINNLLNAKKNDNKKMTTYMQQAFSESKMINELLIYKLLYHIPQSKVSITKNNYIDNMDKICSLLNSFTPLLGLYLESNTWTINTESTRNFIVPKKKILITNTISLQDRKNTFFNTYIAMVTSYLKKCYECSIKYNIKEDTKYDLAWVIVSIRYGE